MSADKEFQKIVKEIKKDKNVLAFWLAGSRGKGKQTKHSDYDAMIIVKDSFLSSYKPKYERKTNPNIELGVMTMSGFKRHAEYGSVEAWDRYNFAHLKPLFDKTGKISELMKSKSTVPKKQQKKIINNALGAFINLVYRLEKDLRDGNKKAAKLEAAECLSFFIEAIFALEGRVRPYNKYLEWELDRYPLKKFPWKKKELFRKILGTIEKDSLHTPLELLNTVRPIFSRNGYSKAFNEWRGYYRVGE